MTFGLLFLCSCHDGTFSASRDWSNPADWGYLCSGCSRRGSVDHRWRGSGQSKRCEDIIYGLASQSAARSVMHRPHGRRVSGDVNPSTERSRDLAIIASCKLTLRLAQSYMFYQLKSFDPSASDAIISTQAGILIGAKTAAHVCTGMLWGRLADSEWGGRRFVLFAGLLSSGRPL